MEATTNQSVYAMLGAAVKGAAGGQLTSASAAGVSGGKFQELMERQQNADSPQKPNSRPEAETAKKPEAKERGEQPAKTKEDSRKTEEEDPRACFDRLVKEGTIVPVGYLNGEGPVQETNIAEAGEQTVESICAAVVAEGVAGPEQDGIWHQPEQADVQSQAERVQAEPETAAAAQTEELVREDAPVQAAPQAEARTQEGPERPVAAEAVRTEASEQEQGDETVTVEYGEAKPEPVFHDVKAAPVKVGEAVRESRTEETADVVRQLDSGLAQALERGETRVELQLTPEHLGAVKVEITRTAEGTVRIALSAQSGETRSLLEKHADGLRAALGSRTQSEVQVEVRKDEGSQRRDDHPYEGHNGQNRQQGERRRQEQPERTEDFLQQLRLGLIPSEDAQE